MQKLAVALPAAVLGLAVTAAPAVAASGTHLGGTFDSQITSSGCLTGVSPSSADVAGVPLTDPQTWGPASGTWRVSIGTKTASARFVIYLNTVPNVAFTIPLSVVSSNGSNVTATGTTGAGELTVAVTNGTMTYTIASYDSTSFMNPAAFRPGGSVTYHCTQTTDG